MQLSEYEKLYKQSIQNPEKFWAEVASSEIEWFKKWDKVFEWKFPNYQWFIGGKLNITYNCLDRHIKDGLGEKIAYVYTNENYERTTITYSQLLQQVNKFANGLKFLGVKKGDKIVLYMPLVIEQIVAMLACARIGAVHSVVFAGFSDKALRERIEDLHAKIVITATWTLRRGAKKELKPTVEEAVKYLDFVEHVVFLNRDVIARSASDEAIFSKQQIAAPSLSLGLAMAGRREIDFYQLLQNQNDTCEPEIMDSEDSLFVLYTSGSTGKPKGIIHTIGGYSVYVHYTTKMVFDIHPVRSQMPTTLIDPPSVNETSNGGHPKNIFWCTADPGWIMGHSYLVYGPLSGLTSIIVEGVPDFPAPTTGTKLLKKKK